MLNRCFWVGVALLAGILGAMAQQVPPAWRLNASVGDPAATRAHQLVQQAIAALGGPKYLHNLDTSGRGRAYTYDSSGELNGGGIRIWIYARYPGQERAELTKKRNVIEIYNGDKGWEVTYRGVRPKTKAEMRDHIERHTHSIGAILRDWAQNPKTLMLDDGIESVDQRQAERIEFHAPGHLAATVDFDLQTHLPRRVSWRQNDPRTGGHSTMSVIYGNYQPFEGIETPLNAQYLQDGTPIRLISLVSVQHTPLSPALFQPPAGRPRLPAE